MFLIYGEYRRYCVDGALSGWIAVYPYSALRSCAKLQRIHTWNRIGARMKLLRLLLLAFAAIQMSIAGAQEAPQPSDPAATNKSPDPAATLAYIHDAWTTLTRSMTDCHSLVDIKVTANPILYMP